MKTIRFDSIDSTNVFAKSFDEGEDFIVIARAQTAGKGTKGRSFDSACGGLYLTKAAHDLPFSAEELFRIMTNASVAVCKTVEAAGLRPSIKWPNDVLIRGRKVCGILIENAFSGKRITRSLVGIGLNVNNALPDELKGIATSLSKEKGETLDLDFVEETLLKNLSREYSLEAYRGYLDFLGQKIRVVEGERSVEGVALGVDQKGRLIVDAEGTKRLFAAAEVSLRL
ncbi:MAG: biotin--[acetyl-CoA-carboxylase] ligase [Christensenellaceae bacterium]